MSKTFWFDLLSVLKNEVYYDFLESNPTNMMINTMTSKNSAIVAYKTSIPSNFCNTGLKRFENRYSPKPIINIKELTEESLSFFQAK